jgi:hypothetical protein
MLQLNIMGTGKSIQQDARNKLGSPPSYICHLDFGCHVYALFNCSQRLFSSPIF